MSEGANKHCVMVFGSLHYDIIVNTPHIPAIDETVIGSSVSFVCGGKGGNQAVAASRMGASVHFAGRVGQDFFADALVRNLTECGIDISNLQRSAEMASGMSVAMVDEAGNYGAVVASGANREINVRDLSIAPDTNCLVLQNEVSLSANVAIAEMARNQGVLVVLNAAPMTPLPHEFLQLVDILIVNRVEAEALLGARGQSLDAMREMMEGASLSTDAPVETLVVTLGGEGLLYKESKGKVHHIAPCPVDVVSTHGAGDCFVGSFCAELAKGARLADCLAFANAAAALYVSTPLGERSALDREKVIAFQAEALR